MEKLDGGDPLSLFADEHERRKSLEEEEKAAQKEEEEAAAAAQKDGETGTLKRPPVETPGGEDVRALRGLSASTASEDGPSPALRERLVAESVASPSAAAAVVDAERAPAGGETNGNGSAGDPGMTDQQTPTTTRQWTPSSGAKDVVLLSGEQMVMSLPDTMLQMLPGKSIEGTLGVTNYRLMFSLSPIMMDRLSVRYPAIRSQLMVPLASVENVREQRSKESGAPPVVVITCKGFRAYRFTFKLEENVQRILATLHAYVFPNNLDLLFAFQHTVPEPLRVRGWDVYDPVVEFQRQGAVTPDAASASAGRGGGGGSSFWRFTTINSNFAVCDSYPQLLVVPTEVPDRDLHAIASFRAEGRLPVLTWGNRFDAASIWRSSQPKVGLNNNSSVQDERMLRTVARAGAGALHQHRSAAAAAAAMNTGSGIDATGRSGVAGAGAAAAGAGMGGNGGDPQSPAAVGAGGSVFDGRAQAAAANSSADSIASGVTAVAVAAASAVAAVASASMPGLADEVPGNDGYAPGIDHTQNVGGSGAAVAASTAPAAAAAGPGHGHGGVGGRVKQPLLHIVDCRPKAAAMANRATGHGYESATNYPLSRIDFMNIGNIHVMRESLNKVMAIATSLNVADTNWSGLIEDSKWLLHIRLVLNAAHHVMQLVHRERATVLVHCSHGWDRTSQVCALAELMLDPYYRTIDGFKVLVEKDWLSFGHPFHLRTAHGVEPRARNDEQMSPVFIQFIDATWQLLRQYPQFFEFNERFLLTIADHIYSCRFGTFLCNNVSERESNRVRMRTPSLWGYLDLNRAAFVNMNYVPCTAEGAAAPSKVLSPSLNAMLRRVTLWVDCYMRFSPFPSIPPVPSQLQMYVHGSLRPLGVSPDDPAAGLLNHVLECNPADAYLPLTVTSSDPWEGALLRERYNNQLLRTLVDTLCHSISCQQTETKQQEEHDDDNGQMVRSAADLVTRLFASSTAGAAGAANAAPPVPPSMTAADMARRQQGPGAAIDELARTLALQADQARPAAATGHAAASASGAGVGAGAAAAAGAGAVRIEQSHKESATMTATPRSNVWNAQSLAFLLRDLQGKSEPLIPPPPPPAATPASAEEPTGDFTSDSATETASGAAPIGEEPVIVSPATETGGGFV